MSSRLTKKQRQRIKRDQEADHKAFMRRGEIRRESQARRDEASKAKPQESPRERHVREQREALERRAAERRADHALPEGYQWTIAVACVGREGELRQKLEAAGIPFLRAQDEIVRVVQGRAQRLKIPILPGMIFVGIEHKDRLADLMREHPWLMQRVPGERFGHVGDRGWDRTLRTLGYRHVEVGDVVPSPGETFPWLVDRYASRGGVDKAGQALRALATVPDSEMRAFADCVIGSAPQFDPAGGFEIGETVRVTDGPFASFNGTIEAIDEARAKLNVAVEIFGRITPVELDFDQVERA